MAVAVGVGRGDEGGGIKEGGVGVVAEDGAEAKGKGGLLMVAMSSMVCPLSFQPMCGAP